LRELQPGYTVRSYQANASRFVSPEVVVLCVEGLRGVSAVAAESVPGDAAYLVRWHRRGE
jgi:hypothetical protein